MSEREAENVIDFDEIRSAGQAATDLAPPVLSEDAVAEEFINRHLQVVRFDCRMQSWVVWKGNRWRKDGTRSAASFVRHLARAIAAGEAPADRRRLGSRKFAEGVERFAREDQRVTIDSDASFWDADYDVIGTPSGIVDLRSGEVYGPSPGMYVTKSVAIDPIDGSPECLRWFQFLNQVTNNDPTLKRFLQQWFGYALTGHIREHRLCYIHGPGGSGKTTLLNVMLSIMADYATTADMSTFTAGKFDQHPEALARLDGMRLVVASETEAGAHWREAKIKAMTGGDPITAHYMRENSFTYRPQFKLTFLGNHPPAIQNLDAAIRRRFLVVPFNYQPPEPDLQLEEVLREEASSILRWAILGAADWHVNGLVVPKAVTDATTQYFDDQDLHAQWLEECCIVDHRNESLIEKTVDMFASWSAFAKRHGEESGRQRVFNERLRHGGFRIGQIKALGTSGARGIRLKTRQHWQEDRE